MTKKWVFVHNLKLREKYKAYYEKNRKQYRGLIISTAKVYPSRWLEIETQYKGFLFCLGTRKIHALL